MAIDLSIALCWRHLLETGLETGSENIQAKMAHFHVVYAADYCNEGFFSLEASYLQRWQLQVPCRRPATSSRNPAEACVICIRCHCHS